MHTFSVDSNKQKYLVTNTVVTSLLASMAGPHTLIVVNVGKLPDISLLSYCRVITCQ